MRIGCYQSQPDESGLESYLHLADNLRLYTPFRSIDVVRRPAIAGRNTA